MASNVPVVKYVSWLSIVPQLAVLGGLIFLYYSANLDEPFIWAAVTYFLLSFALRNFIAKYHRQGMRLVKQQKMAAAIPYFEKSVDYFTRNNWVDKYRLLTLLSSSKLSYKEMGLCNIAFCYSQTGNGHKAREYYEQVLKEFPENGLAIAGLNMITSLTDKTSGTN